MAGDPNVQITHAGQRFLLGHDGASYAIWDRGAPGPVQRFALTPAGWEQAWRTFVAWEPAAVPVAGPGLVPVRRRRRTGMWIGIGAAIAVAVALIVVGIVVLVVKVTGGTTTGATTHPALPSGFELHSNPTAALAIGAPPGWEDRTNDAGSSLVKLVVTASTPATGDVVPNAVVTEEPVSRGVGLELYFLRNLSTVQRNLSPRNIEHHRVTLPAGPAIELTFDRTDPSGRIFRHVDYLLVHDQLGVVLTFTEGPDSGQEAMFALMAQSLRFSR